MPWFLITIKIFGQEVCVHGVRTSNAMVIDPCRQGPSEDGSESEDLDPWISKELFLRKFREVEEHLEISKGVEEVLFGHVRDIFAWKHGFETTWDLPSFKQRNVTCDTPIGKGLS